MLSERVRNIGFSPTLKISGMAQELRAEGVDVLDFSAGQPDFPTPERIKAAGIRAIEQNRTGYTANPGTVELRQTIVDKLKRDSGLDYEPSQVIVSPGAKASLYFACQALLDPGSQALVPSPYWVSYPEQIALTGAEAVYVPTSESDGFRVTVDALREARTDRCRVLFLNYPSNPTGACYDADDLESLAGFCVEHDLWVLADEIYEKLLFDGRTFRSIASFGDAIKDRTVVINGVSKAYSMTGWRIGFAAGPQEVIAGMGRLQSHSTSNATSISQWASIEALQPDTPELREMCAEFQRRRDLLLEGLAALEGIRCATPQGSFYAFPNISGLFGRRWSGGTLGSGEDVAEFLLKEARVAVVPGEGFGAPEFIRLSYAVARDRVEEGVRRIAGALSTLR